MLFSQAETENNSHKDALRIKTVTPEEVLSLEWCFGSDLFPQNGRTVGSKLNLGWKEGGDTPTHPSRPSSPSPSEPPNEAGRPRGIVALLSRETLEINLGLLGFSGASVVT